MQTKEQNNGFDQKGITAQTKGIVNSIVIQKNGVIRISRQAKKIRKRN